MNLCLYGDVQSRYRFITHNKLRIQHQCSGNSDSLTPSAIQLMRITVHKTLRQPYRIHYLLYPPVDLIFRNSFRDKQRFPDQLTDRHSRIQGRKWVLKNNLHTTLKLFQMLFLYIRNVFIFKENFSAAAIQQIEELHGLTLIFRIQTLRQPPMSSLFQSKS